MDTEPKILVVDDEENLLRSVAKTLFREGFDVETANGNPSALVLIQETLSADEPFDLVILDLNMPNFEGKESKYAGLELLERLKTTAPGIPVIINSAWDEVETAKMCIDKGAADYFVKGRTEEMLEKIRKVLGIEE
ncbi:MAG: response regulator [Dehalococcoidia bacterium]|nr:MAG: response regulator [Dehalococcoidia bacterium]